MSAALTAALAECDADMESRAVCAEFQRNHGPGRTP
jgi:hypothetical protein